VQTSAARVVLFYLSQQPATALLSALNWLPVTCRIIFKLACLTYKLLTTSQPAYLHMLLHHYTPTHTLLSTNQFFSLMCHNSPLNLVKDCLVTWLLQSGVDCLLISDFPQSPHLQTPYNNSPFKQPINTVTMLPT